MRRDGGTGCGGRDRKVTPEFLYSFANASQSHARTGSSTLKAVHGGLWKSPAKILDFDDGVIRKLLKRNFHTWGWLSGDVRSSTLPAAHRTARVPEPAAGVGLLREESRDAGNLC